MDYRVVDPDDLDPTPEYPCDRRSIDEAAGFDQLHVARYDLEPGDELARTYHYHEHREEVFHVCSGTLHVETPERTYAVGAGEVFLSKPGSPIRPYNPTDAEEFVRVLAAGAPQYDVARPYEP